MHAEMNEALRLGCLARAVGTVGFDSSNVERSASGRLRFFHFRRLKQAVLGSDKIRLEWALPPQGGSRPRFR